MDANLYTACTVLPGAPRVSLLFSCTPDTPKISSLIGIFFSSEFSDKDLKSVGNYTLGRLIGKGSFGKVYLATHRLTNGSKVCGEKQVLLGSCD